MDKKEVVYMVEYYDNRNRKHMTWVKGFSGVRLLEDRYHVISWETAIAPSSKGKDITLSMLR